MRVVLGVLLCSGMWAMVLARAKSDCTQLPEMLDDEYCCAAPDFTDRVLLKQCEDEGVLKRLENATMACFVTECYMDRVGFVEQGLLSLNKIKRFIETKEYFMNVIWRDAFYDATVTCFQRTYNKDVNKIKERVGQLMDIDLLACDPSFLFYVTCTQTEVMKKCPPEAFNNTPSCQKAQTFLHDCPDYLMTIENWAA